jgi:hypothetical protein
MQLYQEAYGFTQARLVVDVFEGWLGVVVAAVAVSGLVPWRTWVPRFALVTGVLGLLGIAAINPDAWIARQNIDRYAATGDLDVDFVLSLSADAVPTLMKLPENLRPCVVEAAGDLHDDALEWNLGRARARQALKGYLPGEAAASCPSELTGP